MNGDGPPVVPATGPPPQWPTALRRRLGLPLISAIALTGLFGACFASAASVSSTTDTLTANRIAVPRCNPAGIQVFETVTGGAPGVVSSVVLSNIDPACAGGTLNLTLNSGGGTTASVSGTVPGGGGSMTLTFGAAPTLVVGNQVDVEVTGP